jgi:hypothetical protein
VGAQPIQPTKLGISATYSIPLRYAPQSRVYSNLNLEKSPLVTGYPGRTPKYLKSQWGRNLPGQRMFGTKTVVKINILTPIKWTGRNFLLLVGACFVAFAIIGRSMREVSAEEPTAAKEEPEAQEVFRRKGFTSFTIIDRLESGDRGEERVCLRVTPSAALQGETFTKYSYSYFSDRGFWVVDHEEAQPGTTRSYTPIPRLDNEGNHLDFLVDKTDTAGIPQALYDLMPGAEIQLRPRILLDIPRDKLTSMKMLEWDYLGMQASNQVGHCLLVERPEKEPYQFKHLVVIHLWDPGEVITCNIYTAVDGKELGPPEERIEEAFRARGEGRLLAIIAGWGPAMEEFWSDKERRSLAKLEMCGGDQRVVDDTEFLLLCLDNTLRYSDPEVDWNDERMDWNEHGSFVAKRLKRRGT